jgi:hypothetical protein
MLYGSENLGNQMKGGYLCLKRSGIPSEQYSLPEMFENENVSGIECGEFGKWFWSMLHNFSPNLYSDLDRIPLKGQVPQRHVHSSPAIGDISLRFCHIS